MVSGRLEWMRWSGFKIIRPGFKPRDQGIQIRSLRPLDHPLVGLNETKFSNGFLKEINGFGPVGMDEVGL